VLKRLLLEFPTYSEPFLTPGVCPAVMFPVNSLSPNDIEMHSQGRYRGPPKIQRALSHFESIELISVTVHRVLAGRLRSSGTETTLHGQLSDNNEAHHYCDARVNPHDCSRWSLQRGHCTIRGTVRQSAGNPNARLMAHQSVDAQLNRQPTPRSLKREKDLLQAKFAARMSRAERLDKRGDREGCVPLSLLSSECIFRNGKSLRCSARPECRAGECLLLGTYKCDPNSGSLFSAVLDPVNSLF
jgi:hypothetical protein